MTVYEMEGFLRGKCLPGDMKVNESNVQYLVRKLSELQSQNAGFAVQLANAESKCRELAAECAGMKAAFDKPQAYLSWHAIPPTWEDPLPCGEYLDVHDDAGHKNSDGTDCWPIYAKPEINTPATDAFLAELRAQGVDLVCDYHKSRCEALHDVDRNGSHRHGAALCDAIDIAAKIREGVKS